MAKTYEAQQKRAAAQIKKAGMPVSFYFASVDEVPAGTDPSTGLYTAGTPAKEAVHANGHGLVLGYSRDQINGTTILQGDSRVLYSGDRPTVGMLFDYDGKVWKVVGDEPLKLTTVEILNKGVQIRV